MIQLIFKGNLIGGERKFPSVEACEAFILGVATGCPEALHGDCVVQRVGFVEKGKELRGQPRTVIGGYEDLQRLAANWGVSI